MPWVYILRFGDNTLYVGHTTDLTARLRRHRAGLATAYTAARLPVDLVYSEECESIERAVEREQQINRWGAMKKDALVRDDRDALGRLAKRRGPPQRAPRRRR